MARSRSDAQVAGLGAAWDALVTLGRSLDERAFGLPTACPGWTVKDQFSHVIGTELLLEGRCVPHGGVAAPHARNALGELNERSVALRRGETGSRVVAELAALTERRLDALAQLDDEAQSATVGSPTGIVAYVDYLGQRAFESYVHEQDVRHAVGQPGGRGGYGESVALDRLEASMPFVLGRRVAPAPGTTLRLEITGALARTIQLEVADGDGAGPSARAIDVLHESPHATLRMDAEVFARRACGRMTANATRRRRTTSIAGDVALASAFIDGMVVVS